MDLQYTNICAIVKQEQMFGKAEKSRGRKKWNFWQQGRKCRYRKNWEY